LFRDAIPRRMSIRCVRLESAILPVKIQTDALPQLGFKFLCRFAANTHTMHLTDYVAYRQADGPHKITRSAINVIAEQEYSRYCKYGSEQRPVTKTSYFIHRGGRP